MPSSPSDRNGGKPDVGAGSEAERAAATGADGEESAAAGVLAADVGGSSGTDLGAGEGTPASTTSPAAAAPLPGAGTAEGGQLRLAHDAFTVGDYRRVRRLTEPLLEAPDGDVARSARDLRRRTQIDPVQLGVVLACLFLFLAVAYAYVFADAHPPT